MDVVYPVRPGEENDELRYSLRSLHTNFPHGRVWIVGHKPGWLRGVEYIRGNTAGGTVGAGRANVYNNIRLAVDNADLSDRVAIFNDDFFVTEPVADIPTFYRSTLNDHMGLPGVLKAGGWWLESLRTTQTCLQAYGFANPLSYELHMPFVVDRAAMSETLAMFRHVQPRNPPQWRTLYGNVHGIGGAQSTDVKCYQSGTSNDLHRPFHSTMDSSFPKFQPALHALFPDPSPYEA